MKYHKRFKLCNITFKALLFCQPTYHFNYFVPLQNSRLLRSSNTNMLTDPLYGTKWGSRAFAVAAPPTWNSLPVILRTGSTTGSNHKGGAEYFAEVSSERCAALSANTILSPQRSSHSTQFNVSIPKQT